MLYKRFTRLLHHFTTEKLQASSRPISLLYSFTKSFVAVNNYILAFLLLIPFSIPQSSLLPDSHREQMGDMAGAANIVFKSTDGGQTWQDIGKGLPENLKENDIQRVFTNDNGLYLRTGNGLYHNQPNSTSPFWKKEIFPDKQGSIAPGKAGMYAYNFDWQSLRKVDSTRGWVPADTNFQWSLVRTVFETAGGTLFMASRERLFRSTDNGKTWKLLFTGVGKIVESNGVLLGTGPKGILRSTDDGENWKWMLMEGGVGIDVEPIKGGFAAITYSSASNTRRVRTSYDGGLTWQPIDAGLPAQLSITSIIQAGEDFFCGHPDGILKSSDQGKTWKLLLPSKDGKIFNLFVSGNVIYALSRTSRGC